MRRFTTGLSDHGLRVCVTVLLSDEHSNTRRGRRDRGRPRAHQVTVVLLADL